MKTALCSIACVPVPSAVSSWAGYLGDGEREKEEAVSFGIYS